MALNGTYARKSLWGKVDVFRPSGELLYRTARIASSRYNPTTIIYKFPEKTEWIRICHTAGSGLFTSIHEIVQHDKTLANIEVKSENPETPAGFGKKEEVLIQDSERKPLGFIEYNEALGGKGIIFSSFTIKNVQGQPLAIIDNKDRNAKVKLVVHETYVVLDDRNNDEAWKIIISVLLILKTAGFILS